MDDTLILAWWTRARAQPYFTWYLRLRQQTGFDLSFQAYGNLYTATENQHRVYLLAYPN
jgi:hypothetical protein